VFELHIPTDIQQHLSVFPVHQQHAAIFFKYLHISQTTKNITDLFYCSQNGTAEFDKA